MHFLSTFLVFATKLTEIDPFGGKNTVSTLGKNYGQTHIAMPYIGFPRTLNALAIINEK